MLNLKDLPDKEKEHIRYGLSRILPTLTDDDDFATGMSAEAARRAAAEIVEGDMEFLEVSAERVTVEYIHVAAGCCVRNVRLWGPEGSKISVMYTVDLPWEDLPQVVRDEMTSQRLTSLRIIFEIKEG